MKIQFEARQFKECTYLLVFFNSLDEGVQPLFRQSAKLIASSTTPSEEYRRIIAVAPSSRGPGNYSIIVLYNTKVTCKCI